MLNLILYKYNNEDVECSALMFDAIFNKEFDYYLYRGNYFSLQSNLYFIPYEISSNSSRGEERLGRYLFIIFVMAE